MGGVDKESVCIRFVLLTQYGNEDETALETKLCFKNCQEYNFSPTWIQEKKCLKLQPTKRDVFVCEKFEGAAFEYLRTFKSVILGPRALLSCLQKGVPIPSGGTTIFTLAMKDLIVTSTNFPDEERDRIEEKVGFMGGLYSKRLVVAATHLVANSVRSVKYEKANDLQIPIMTDKWVDAVWEASQERDVMATDDEFKAYSCPPFHNLVISCTNLMRAEKERVVALIEQNGGVFSGVLESERTKILVVKDRDSKKYNYARIWHLPCVTPSWIYKSAREGYALNVEDFDIEKIYKRKCSTPVHESQAPHLPDISTISAIGGCSSTNRNMVDETRLDETAATVASQSVASKHSSGRPGTHQTKNYVDVIGKLDVREAKKAGNFLDGCNVYLSGFSPDTNEKLRRLLNGGGATRYNEISSKVSHVIVGEFVASDMKAIRASNNRPHVVTADWIIESIKLHCPAPEDQYSCLEDRPAATEPPSPSLKKGLQLLQTKGPPIPFPALDETADVDPELVARAERPQMNLIPQYLNQDTSFHDIGGGNLFKDASRGDTTATSARRETQGDTTTEMSSTMMDGESTQVPIFFAGLTFLVVGFDDDGQDQEICEAMIEKHGGRVVSRSFKGIPDYGVVPFQGATLHHPTNEVVTNLWLEDCQVKGELLPMEYFHKPVALPLTAHPLKGVVLGLSSYSGRERVFLSLLAEGLGALSQEVFARKDNAKKNALASTHLVCREASGTKYEAATKWKVPTVSHKWLLACLRESRQMPEEDYPVGEDSLSLTNVSLATEPVPAEMPIVMVPVNHGSARSASSGQPASQSLAARLLGKSLMPDGMKPPTTPAAMSREYGFSQETPIRFPRLSTGTPQRRSLAVADGNQDSPLVPTGDTPRLFGQVATPETPYGLQENPSPETRKRWKRWIDTVPEFEKDETPAKKAKRLSTPIPELYRRCWTKFGARTGDENAEAAGSSGAFQNNDVDNSTPTRHADNQQMDLSGTPELQGIASSHVGAGINTQLNQLNELLLSSPSIEANSTDDGNKLPTRRPSMMEPASSSQKTLVVANASTENKTIETAVKESQSDVIGWADHSRHNTKELETSTLPAVADGERGEVEVKPPPKFMLSSIENREHYIKMIQDLGGTVTESENFDPTATHLVCTKTTRSEKLLACIASGKWILHNAFLEESHDQGHFLKEEFYEWGNPASYEVIGRMSTQSLNYKLAEAAHRWRKKLVASEEGGAFKGIRAIVYTNKERIGAIKRLIMAGGGTIVDASFPFSDPGSATHCFVERNKVHASIDMRALYANGTLCLESIFLNNFLVENPPPLDSDCVVPAYRELMKK